MEHHVVCHMDTLRYGIVHAILLGATLVAEEDNLATMVFKLLQVRHHVLDVYDAPKRLEVVYHRLLPVPCLERGCAIQALCGIPIQHIYSSTHRLAPEPAGKALGLVYAPGG
jgi:hypothetical protein